MHSKRNSSFWRLESKSLTFGRAVKWGVCAWCFQGPSVGCHKDFFGKFKVKVQSVSLDTNNRSAPLHISQRGLCTFTDKFKSMLSEALYTYCLLTFWSSDVWIKNRFYKLPETHMFGDHKRPPTTESRFTVQRGPHAKICNLMQHQKSIFKSSDHRLLVPESASWLSLFSILVQKWFLFFEREVC